MTDYFKLNYKKLYYTFNSEFNGRKSFLKYSKKCTYLIAPDYVSGKKNVYTIYRIPPAPSMKVKIIGRELDKKYCLDFLKKIIEKDNK